MLVLADVFTLLSYINEKRKVPRDICNSVALFVYIPHIFHLDADWSTGKKTKGDKNFMMWMVELFMDVDKLMLVMNIFKNFVVIWVCLSLYFQITTKTFRWNWKSLPNISQRKVCQRSHPNYVEQSMLLIWVFLLMKSQRKCFTYLNGVITTISTDTGKSLILQFYPKVLKSVPKCRR